MRPVINLDELGEPGELGEPAVRSHGERFERGLSAVGRRIGAQRLGYNVTRVPPGKRASPFHSHHVNEEMFFILDGRGTLRFGAERHAVRAGDFVACPPGDSSVAHQLINDSEADLVYLAVSTMDGVDVWSYPDSGKFGVGCGPAPDGGEAAGASFPDRYLRVDAAVDYWEGEH